MGNPHKSRHEKECVAYRLAALAKQLEWDESFVPIVLKLRSTSLLGELPEGLRGVSVPNSGL
jgi:hypothetical protein